MYRRSYCWWKLPEVDIEPFWGDLISNYLILFPSRKWASPYLQAKQLSCSSGGCFLTSCPIIASSFPLAPSSLPHTTNFCSSILSAARPSLWTSGAEINNRHLRSGGATITIPQDYPHLSHSVFQRAVKLHSKLAACSIPNTPFS